MEEGTKSKKTVFVGGLAENVDENLLLATFSTFGDVIEVQLPTHAAHGAQPTEAKHRGFGFVTFSSSGDAQDAIDNMDMNELQGKVLKVNIARPMKAQPQLQGNRAVWESEDWLKEYAKPLAESGGLQNRGKSAEAEDGEQDDAMDE